MYYHLSYGAIRIRVKPSLWTHLHGEGFDVGDQVEVISRFGLNTPLVGPISDVLYSQIEQRIIYQVMDREFEVPKNFHSEDLVQHTSHQLLREGDTIHPAQRYEPVKGMDTLPLE